MRRKIGTVIKINDRKAAIMTRDCEMLYIKKQPGMYPGLEIQFGTNEIISIRKSMNLTIKIVSSVAAIFIFVFFISNFFDKNDNYTYICIDGKSSIELAVDGNMKVVNVSSIDKKIQEKLMKIGLESKSLENALSDLLANNNSFFNEEAASDDLIIISAYSKDSKNNGEIANNNIENVLSACKNTVEDLNNNFSYYFVGISEDARRLAEKNNISAGRYYVYEIAQEQGENISLDQAKEMKVGELVKIVRMPHPSFSNKIVNNEANKIEAIKDPKATPVPTVKKETLPPKNNAAKPDNTKNTPEADVSKETPDIKIPNEDNNKEETVGANPEIEGSYSSDNSTTEEKTLPSTPTPTPTPTRRTGTKLSATPVPTKTNNTKVSPTPAKSDSDDAKAPPTPVKSDEEKAPPAPAKPDSDEDKVPPAPAKPDSGEEKTPPAPAKPDSDEEKTPPAPAKPDSDEDKVPPAPAKPDSDEEKTPPVPAKSYSEDTKAPPVPAKSESDEDKAPPAPAKSESDEEKTPPAPAKSESDEDKAPPAPARSESDEEKESST